MEMEKENLDEILENHVAWLHKDGGKRANLRGANLCKTFLRGAELEGADLRGANLEGADLFEANLCGANLDGANLNGADLRRAKLEGAYLDGANLEAADLEGAELPIGIYQIVGAGSCNRCTTYDAINDRVICGCWNDDEGNHLDSFTRRVEEIYGANGEMPYLEFYQEYMAAISFFKAMKELRERFYDNGGEGL